MRKRAKFIKSITAKINTGMGEKDMNPNHYMMKHAAPKLRRLNSNMQKAILGY